MLVPMALMLAAAPTTTAALPSAKAAVPPPAQTPVECPERGIMPEGCTQPPLKDYIEIYSSWKPQLRNAQAAAGLVREPVRLWRNEPELPLTGFPAALRRGDLETSGEAELALTIGPDDAVTGCAVIALHGREGLYPGPEKAEIALVPATGANACQLVKANRTFRHAIDRGGQPVAAELRMSVHYQRKRRNTAYPPPPSPPSRWVGQFPYDSSPAWVPRWFHSGPATAVSFSAPRWKDFLGQRKEFPKAAAVGVLLDFDRGGMASGCRIGASSGDQALDLATCAALATVRNKVQSGWPVQNYPVLVRWNKNQGEIVLPLYGVVPAMTAPLQIAETDFPAGVAPKSATRLWVQIGPDGKQVSCQIDYPYDNDDAFDARACRLVAERARFTGARDLFGTAAVGGLNLRVDWAKRTIVMAPGYF